MAEDTIERRSFLKAAGGAVATASVAGCTGNGNGNGNGEGSDKTLIYARGAHDVPIDPQQTTSGEVAKVTNQIFDTLIKFKPGSGGQLTDGLATEYGLEGETASLTLREGVTFHNGEEFTAADFKATYRRFVDEGYAYTLGGSASGYGPFTLGSWIDSVNVAGDYELEIQLSQKYAPFLRNLAMFATAVLSKAQLEEVGEAPESDDAENPQAGLGNEVLPVGTGPFEAENIDNQNERIQLTATDDYFNPGPFVGGVVFKTIKQNSTRAAEVVNGDSHITDNLDSQSSKQIDNSNNAELKSKSGINVGYMAFNMERKEAFRDVKVRRAVSYAVNTGAIVNDIFEGFAAQAEMMQFFLDTDQLQQAVTLAREAMISHRALQLGHSPEPVSRSHEKESGRQKAEDNLNDLAHTASEERSTNEDDLADLWSQLTDARNDINHAGMNANPAPGENLSGRARTVVDKVAAYVSPGAEVVSGNQ